MGEKRPSHVSTSILGADAPSVCKSPTDRRREATDCQGPIPGRKFGLDGVDQPGYRSDVLLGLLGSMVTVGSMGYFTYYIYVYRLINGIYIEVITITHRLTIDPNFLGHPGR